jgi:hypothetical protein
VRPTWITVIALAFISIVIPTHAQITTNVFRRVLEIRVGGRTGITGTAFTLDVDGKEYLITAKHMVAKLKHQDAIEIGVKADQWESIGVTVYPCESDTDIAVLIPPRQLTVNFPLEPISDSAGAFAGQDMYFLGFPWGASLAAISVYANHLNGEYPMAIIKKGVYSGTFEEKDKPPVILLDGYNNHGFSGGPIVYRDLRRPNEIVFYVLGVVSGFVPELSPVFKSDPLKPGEDTSTVESWRLKLAGPGKILRDTGRVVPLNSGVVKGSPIKYALDLISKHPDGPAVTADF